MDAEANSRLSMRDAGATDVPILARLNWHLIRDEGHRNPMTVAQLEERMRHWLDADYHAMLFNLGDVVIGYALFRDEPEHVYLRQFFIGEEFRRRGFGRQTLDFLIERLKLRARTVRLDVLTGNHAGIAFWRAVGFHDYCLTMERMIDDRT